LTPILLEICTASVDDCVAAAEGGADRVELNAALALGGLTPPLGVLIEARQSVSIPIIAMVRPRPGGFHYSTRDFAAMQRDAGLLLEHGADGLAFGILHADGTVDTERCKALIRQMEGREAVFHRAFDVVPEPSRVLEQLIDLGVTRVLTSGQEASAYNGAANIAAYVEQAAGRIEVLPGGGINRFTIADVLARTGCNQVHASLTMLRTDPSTQARPHIAFGGAVRAPEDQFSTTSADAVADLRRRLGPGS
jgi:copper homeostasis protein